MNIEIDPETERLVREEISSGHFRSVDDLIKAGLEAWSVTGRNFPAHSEQFFSE